MTRTPQFLSILDVAHHWCDVPVPVELGPLPPSVRNMVTALLGALLNGRLGVYEPTVVRVPVPGLVEQISLYMHPIEELPVKLEEMFCSGIYDAKVLATLRLRVEEVFMWAADGTGDIPDFCIPEWAWSKPEQSNATTKVRPEAEDKRKCQEIARQRWAEDDEIRIAEMARTREIQIEGNGALYQPVTVIGWLREVAPDAVRNRRGRPVKKRGQT